MAARWMSWTTLALPLAVSLALMTGCPQRRESLNRTALLESIRPADGRALAPLPTLEDMRALRAPVPSTVPPGLGAEEGPLAVARRAIHVDGDRAAWLTALQEAPDGADAATHVCLVAVALVDVEAAEAACVRAMDAAPGSMASIAAWSALGSLRAVDAGLGARLADVAASRLGACREGPVCAEMTWLLAGDVASRAEVLKDEAGVRDAIKRRGVLTAARVEGPFAGDALGAYASEGRGEVLEPRPGRFVATNVEPYRGIVTPAQRSEAGLYRLTWGARAERRQDVRVIVRCTDACRVRVDGELLGERHPVLSPGPDVLRLAARLGRGEHRFEVLTWADSGADAVELAVLSIEGQPALVAAAPRDGRSDAIGALAWPVPHLDEKLTLAAVDHDLALAWAEHAGFGRSPAALRFQQGALVRTAGFSPVVLATVAGWWSGAASVADERGQAEARPLWTGVSARWPGHPAAQLAAASRWVEADPDEALLRLNVLIDARPGYLPAHRLRAPVAMGRGAFDEALASAQALAAHPEASAGDLLRAGDVMEAADRVVDELVLRRRAAERARDLFGAEEAEELLARGHRDEARDVLERLGEVIPGHLAEERLWGLLEIDAPARALGRIGEHLERFPNDRSAWRRRAEVAAAVGGVDAGRAVVRSALKRFSADRELHAIAIELGETPPWQAALREGDAAVDAWLQLSPRPWRGHPVVFVRDVIERRLFEDQGQIAIRHFVAELATEQAVDAYGELSVGPDEQMVRLRVIKPDGAIFEPELVSGVGAVSLPGLAPGDLVELIAISYADAPAMDGFAFEVRPLEGPAPAVVRAYLFEAPEALFKQNLTLIEQGDLPAPTVTREGGRRRVAYLVRDVDARRHEPDAAPAEVSVMTVGFARGATPETWARVRGAPLLRQARVTPWLAAVAREVAGVGSSTERMWNIWRFVQSRVGRADGPAGAEEVLAAGRGQRVPLLLALLDGAGLEVTPVALHVPAWTTPLEVPSVQHFALLGVRVEHIGETTVIIGDGGVGVPNALPPAARGGQLLDLALDRTPDPGLLGWFGAQGSRLDDLPDDVVAEEAPVRVALDLEANGDGVTGFLALQVPRHQAEPLRDAFLAADDRQLRAAFEQLLGPTLPGVVVTDLQMPALRRRGEALGVGVQLALPDVGRGGQPVRLDRLFPDGATTALGLFPGLSRYTQLTDRQRPLRITPGHEIVEVQVRLPEGGAFTEVPDPASLSAGSVELAVRAEVTDGTLYYRRELVLGQDEVSPDAWRRLRPALVALAAAAEARLAFLLPDGSVKTAAEMD
jgi:tetratricopeptide (TPR) repeat protein